MNTIVFLGTINATNFLFLQCRYCNFLYHRWSFRYDLDIQRESNRKAANSGSVNIDKDMDQVRIKLGCGTITKPNGCEKKTWARWNSRLKNYYCSKKSWCIRETHIHSRKLFTTSGYNYYVNYRVDLIERIKI